MSYSGNQNVNVGVSQPAAAPDLRENTGAGPLANPMLQSGVAPQYTPRRVTARSRFEKFGFWVIVAAAILVVLVLLGFVLGHVVGGLIEGAYIGFFAGMLTLANLSRPSSIANTILGRRVFPVVHAQDGDIWRLAAVNAGLMFAFTFAFGVIASFLGEFLAGLLVTGGIVGLGIFYNRARKVIVP